jgi:LysR family hydrogen peroxide-inducible transcriptional activator
MNLQQLEYIIAVDHFRHFAKAAEKSCVTQPTLSMMIQKLEEEIGVKIFDRSKQPVAPTREGIEIINRAKLIVGEAKKLKDYAKELKGQVSGEISIGIIPTLAPYLLPLFINSFSAKYPEIKLHIKELFTNEIINNLKQGDLDIGLLAGPLNEPQLAEVHLFFEEFFVYASKTEKLPKKKYLLPTQIDVNRLLLLEEGHCLRNQVFNLCALKKVDENRSNLYYEAGSIETLINLVDSNNGITIIPKLATYHLRKHQLLNIREFASPKPVRDICLVTRNSFPRKKIIEFLSNEITSAIPFTMSGGKNNILAV